MAGSCYIYGLRPKGGEVFYVGSTKHDIQDRLKAHLDYIRNGQNNNKYFVNKVNRIGYENIEVVQLEEVTPNDRWIRERDWIQKLLADEVKLVNRIHNDIHYPIESYEDECEENGRYWASLSVDELSKLYVTFENQTASNPRNQQLLEKMCELGKATLDRMIELKSHNDVTF